MTDHSVQTTDRDLEEESKGGPWIDLRVRIPKASTQADNLPISRKYRTGNCLVAFRGGSR
jgi:hypothetical protein